MKMLSRAIEKCGWALFSSGLFLIAISSKENRAAVRLMGEVLKEAANAKA